MAIAAVPAYLGKDFSSASPGLQFGMYLQLWGVDRRSGDQLWKSHDISYEKRGHDSQERQVKNENKALALQAATRLTPNDQQTMQALLARQQTLFDKDQGLVIEAQAVAPFTTGLGNEHPTENGFAFLNPYGLPYLPGSGVKGVLRQAARELASGEWGERHGWSEEKIFSLSRDGNAPVKLSLLDILFGKESKEGDKEHIRGVLTFWDVIPQIKGDKLAVEIMTPHQRHYYQEDRSPHESGKPIPISFLTVPPRSSFTFHVQCHQALLQYTAPALENQWQALLQAAFHHAFSWLGFGAKTAVGYGAMADKQEINEAKERQLQENLQAAGIASGCSVWERALIIDYSPGAGEIKIKNTDEKLASGKFYSVLPDNIKKRLKNKKPVYLQAEVEEMGNQFTIKSVTLLD